VRRGEGGQALVAAVVLLGMAAAAIVGLLHAQERLLGAVRDGRAGEAAVAAAGTAVADRYHALARSLGRDPSAAETAAFAADPAVTETAREAAVGMARAHGRADPSEVRVRSFGIEVEVDLLLAGRRHVALLESFP